MGPEVAGQRAPEEDLQRGLSLLNRGFGAEAFEQLTQAYQRNPKNAGCRSGYALGLALVQGQFLPAMRIAQDALSREFYNPDLYLHLVQIYLAAGQKSEAIHYLEQGEQLDGEHPGLFEARHEVGDRRSPVLPFLARSNPLNRWLGRLRTHWGQSRILART